MKLSKLFHTLYATVMALPVLVIPIFALNILHKETEPISIEVQEKVSVDFNQLVVNGLPNSLDTYTLPVNSGTLTYNENSITYQVTNIVTPAYNQAFGNYAGQGNGINMKNNHKYYSTCTITCNKPCTIWIAGTAGYGWSHTFTGYETYNYEYIFTRNGDDYGNRYFYVTNFNNDLDLYFTITNNQLFDLTQMGIDNYTISDFKTLFPNNYYNFTLSQKMLVNKPSPTTYNSTDIGSQFVYALYKPVHDYFNFGNFFGLGGMYDWFQLNIFNGTAPLSFFIVFNVMIYWLFISLFWLLFDILIYVPMVIHKWLDKAEM